MDGIGKVSHAGSAASEKKIGFKATCTWSMALVGIPFMFIAAVVVRPCILK
jgi:hypothetical protein